MRYVLMELSLKSSLMGSYGLPPGCLIDKSNFLQPDYERYAIETHEVVWVDSA